MQKKLLEAALFMSPKPLATDELVKITGADSLTQLQSLIAELRQDYQQRGMVINETPFGYQMQVHYELLSKVSHLTPYADLSEGCKRTLALAVYKEPIMQSEVIKIQGNKAYTYVQTLEDMGLVKAERYGRTKLLRLTAEFERYFGMRKEQVRALIEKDIGQPAPTNLNAFMAPPEPEPLGTAGLHQLFEAPKTVTETDITKISSALKIATPPLKAAAELLPSATPSATEELPPLKAAAELPSLSFLDSWELPTEHHEPAAPALHVRTSAQQRPAGRVPAVATVTKKSNATLPAAKRRLTGTAAGAALPATRLPASQKTVAGAVPSTARTRLSAIKQKSITAALAGTTKTRIPLKAALPGVTKRLPIKQVSTKHMRPLHQAKGTQTVLSVSGAVKPDVPVETKKKKARRKVMHKSAVKEETRDEKNIFSSEGEIKL